MGNETNIELKAGTLYVNDEKFCEIGEFTVDNAVDNAEENFLIVHQFDRFSQATGEVALYVKIAGMAFVKLIHELTGYDKYLRETCPNRRVVYLAYHAKKARARNKNYKRMMRICAEQEKENENN